MNRFVQQNGAVYWQDADGMHIAGGQVDQTRAWVNSPGFKEFLGADGDILEHYMFELKFIDIDHDIVYLDYRSIIVRNICATLSIILPRGERQLTYVPCGQCECGPHDMFDERHKSYLTTCDTIRNMKAELIRADERIAQLAAENAELKAENTELRYRPGGPGYDEAASHFSTLS